MKRYDDPIKRDWRKELANFSEDSLPKKPRDWAVLCMPSDECYEIESYLDLGVMPSGIIAAEWDKRKAKRIERKYGIHGVEVVGYDVKDYLRNAQRKFDLINLDYETNMNTGVIAAVKLIAGRQLLNDPGVFGLTVYAQREDEFAKRCTRAGS